MSYTHIIVEPRDGLLSIILNRPDKRNALSLELMTELLDAFLTVGASKDRGVMRFRPFPSLCWRGFKALRRPRAASSWPAVISRWRPKRRGSRRREAEAAGSVLLPWWR